MSYFSSLVGNYLEKLHGNTAENADLLFQSTAWRTVDMESKATRQDWKPHLELAMGFFEAFWCHLLCSAIPEISQRSPFNNNSEMLCHSGWKVNKVSSRAFLWKWRIHCSAAITSYLKLDISFSVWIQLNIGWMFGINNCESVDSFRYNRLLPVNNLSIYLALPYLSSFCFWSSTVGCQHICPTLPYSLCLRAIHFH